MASGKDEGEVLIEKGLLILRKLIERTQDLVFQIVELVLVARQFGELVRLEAQSDISVQPKPSALPMRRSPTVESSGYWAIPTLRVIWMGLPSTSRRMKCLSISRRILSATR